MEKKLKDLSGSHTFIIDKDNPLSTIYIEDFSSNDREVYLEILVKNDDHHLKVIGRALGEKKQHKKWNVLVSLEGKNQNVQIDLKGIANDSATLEFHGGSIAKKNSEQGSIAIDEKIVLFSPQAKAKATPILRVETENISTASHSACVAPFSTDTFFFFESRGVSKPEAKEILKEGFLTIDS